MANNMLTASEYHALIQAVTTWEMEKEPTAAKQKVMDSMQRKVVRALVSYEVMDQVRARLSRPLGDGT